MNYMIHGYGIMVNVIDCKYDTLWVLCTRYGIACWLDQKKDERNLNVGDKRWVKTCHFICLIESICAICINVCYWWISMTMIIDSDMLMMIVSEIIWNVGLDIYIYIHVYMYGCVGMHECK